MTNLTALFDLDASPPVRSLAYQDGSASRGAGLALPSNPYCRVRQAASHLEWAAGWREESDRLSAIGQVSARPARWWE